MFVVDLTSDGTYTDLLVNIFMKPAAVSYYADTILIKYA